LLKVSQKATLTGCGADPNLHWDVPVGELAGVLLADGAGGSMVLVAGGVLVDVLVAVGGTDVLVAGAWVLVAVGRTGVVVLVVVADAAGGMPVGVGDGVIGTLVLVADDVGSTDVAGTMPPAPAMTRSTLLIVVPPLDLNWMIFVPVCTSERLIGTATDRCRYVPVSGYGHGTACQGPLFRLYDRVTWL
jgi:hypothetical protein